MKFIAETILPRACTNLEKPGSAKSLAALTMLGLETNKYNTFMQTLGLDLAKLGYPSLMMTFAYTPLDFIGDFLRYPTGMLLDVRRHPDDVRCTCEALIEPIVKVALALKPLGANLAFISLHLNEYLSPKLYAEFYWNYLKKIIIELFNQGIKSFVFFEGHHDAHLETILDLPKGWGIAYFEKTCKKSKEHT